MVEAVSPTVMKIPNSYAKVAVSALVGGSVSAATGGKFGNGAITGAFQMALNEIAHNQKDCALSKADAQVRKYNAQSIKENREIGGVVWEMDGIERVTDPVYGPSCNANADCGISLEGAYSQIPDRANILYEWHTHGGGSSPAFSFFSPEDLGIANYLGKTYGLRGSLIGTPMGEVKLYTPGTINCDSDLINRPVGPVDNYSRLNGTLIQQQKILVLNLEPIRARN